MRENGVLARELRPFQMPGAFFLTGEDNLRVVSLNASSATDLTIVARVLSPEGRILPHTFRHVMNTDRTAATTNHTLGEGWLLDAVAFVATGTPLVGQTFVRLQIVRGSSGAFAELATIAQGVCNAVQRVAYPGSDVRTTEDAPPAIRSVTGTNPAAGAEVSETVPTGARWDPLAIFVTLVTAVAVANREVSIVFDDGANTLLEIPSGVSQIASLTRNYNYYHAAERFTLNVAADFTIPIPRLVLLAGYRIRTATSNLQGADDFGAPQLLVREWLEGS